MSKKKQLIIITHGMEDGLRQLIFGYQYAMTLQNLGQDVTIFLTGQAVKSAIKDCPDTIQGSKIDILHESVSQFLESGGTLLVCITCIREVIDVKQHASAQACLISGAKVAGLNTIAELGLDSQVVSF